MSERIRVGNVFVEVPEGATGIGHAQKPLPLKAEKPDTPEPLEEQQYIYRPNDPFRSAIDEAHAIASISASQKPWVKKTWFVIFIIGPLLYAELAALATVVQSKDAEPWKSFFITNAVALPVWLVFYSIWRRKVKNREIKLRADG